MPKVLQWALGLGGTQDPWLSVGVPSQDPCPTALGTLGKASPTVGSLDLALAKPVLPAYPHLVGLTW